MSKPFGPLSDAELDCMASHTAGSSTVLLSTATYELMTEQCREANRLRVLCEQLAERLASASAALGQAALKQAKRERPIEEIRADLAEADISTEAAFQKVKDCLKKNGIASKQE